MSKTIPDLSGFYGTENYYKNPFGIIYTDGIKYLATELGAYWLINLVASYRKKLQKEEFQLWKVSVTDNKVAVITCRRDTGEKPLVTQKVGYTDFPVGDFEFYVVNNVMMLKSEY
jgi:hypothetical protein